ncbi:MAG: hypothetical protein Tsb005_17710 [Gammaproteobacteria bacterium]
MGTNGLIVQAQSREEIYADKMLAFALRPNRLKYRDLWDMLWLHQQGLKPTLQLIPLKLKERKLTIDYFFKLYNERKQLLTEDKKIALAFKNEMQRFLPPKQINEITQHEQLWGFIVYLISDLGNQLQREFIK